MKKTTLALLFSLLLVSSHAEANWEERMKADFRALNQKFKLSSRPFETSELFSATLEINKLCMEYEVSHYKAISSLSTEIHSDIVRGEDIDMKNLMLLSFRCMRVIEAKKLTSGKSKAMVESDMDSYREMLFKEFDSISRAE